MSMSEPGRVGSRGGATRRVPAVTAEGAYRPSHRPEKLIRSPYPTRPAEVDYREDLS